jgi:extracellular elastinolytic metalloproteinase
MLASFLAGCGLFAIAASHPSHGSGLARRAIDVNAFRLTATSEYVNATATETSPSLHRIKRGDYIESATELVKSTVKGATFRVVGDHYVGDNGVGHVNFKQTANGLDIDNADFNVNVSMSFTVSLAILMINRLRKMDQFSPMATLSSVDRSHRSRSATFLILLTL